MGIINLVNQKFGKLTVLEQDMSKTGGNAYWICKCDCGNIKSIRGQRLRNGEVTNCGCEKKKREIKIDTNFIGQKFGRLTVLERDLTKPSGKGQITYWICQCECGNKKSISRSQLTSGKTQSCGCLKTEKLIERNTLDLTNQRFGKVVALENTYKLSNHHSYIWRCKCDCGNDYFTSAESLTSGRIHSCGCQKKSYGEESITKILLNNNIPFCTEYVFSDLKNEDTNGYYRFDFVIFDKDNHIKRIIEFDGAQHFFKKENSFFNFDKIKKADIEKNNYCKTHNIPLVRIPYTELDNLSLELIMGDKYLL